MKDYNHDGQDELSGSFTALVTPFKNGALDEKAFRDLVDGRSPRARTAWFPVGTTARAPTVA
jgi:4-hydroxy-tetrahydrodipicolinate synthase